MARAQFTDEQVREIRRLAAGGMGSTDLAKRFKASRSAVNFAAIGINYKHITDVAPVSGLGRPRGLTCHQALLDEDKVREIRRSFKNGLAANIIAEAFGVSRGCILGVVHGRTWKHVADDPVEVTVEVAEMRMKASGTV